MPANSNVSPKGEMLRSSPSYIPNAHVLSLGNVGH